MMLWRPGSTRSRSNVALREDGLRLAVSQPEAASSDAQARPTPLGSIWSEHDDAAGPELGSPQDCRFCSVMRAVVAASFAVGVATAIYEYVWSIQVQGLIVGPTDFVVETRGPGFLDARVKSNVASQIQGRIAGLAVDDGSFVKAGQVMARLESNEFEASLSLMRRSLL